MTTPYTYGYRAGRAWYKYETPATNPYGYDSESRKEWQRGFDAGQKDASEN